MPETRRINGISALEMTMRDVLDNMADFGTQIAYDTSVPGCFEILAIEPAETPDPAREQPFRRHYPAKAPVLDHPCLHDREVA